MRAFFDSSERKIYKIEKFETLFFFNHLKLILNSFKTHDYAQVDLTHLSKVLESTKQK